MWDKIKEIIKRSNESELTLYFLLIALVYQISELIKYLIF